LALNEDLELLELYDYQLPSIIRSLRHVKLMQLYLIIRNANLTHPMSHE